MVLAIASLLTHLKSIERGVVLIDGNNVRGADRFALSQQALCDRVAEWAAAERLPSIVVLDHGDQRAWPLGEFAVCTLSGDVQTADDVCVRDALWLRQRHRSRQRANFQSQISKTPPYRRVASARALLRPREQTYGPRTLAFKASGGRFQP